MTTKLKSSLGDCSGPVRITLAVNFLYFLYFHACSELISGVPWCVVTHLCHLYRLLNSHNFTVYHTVSLPFSRSNGRFFISYGFTNFERFLFSNSQFYKRNKHKQHIPMLLRNAFLV